MNFVLNLLLALCHFYKTIEFVLSWYLSRYPWYLGLLYTIHLPCIPFLYTMSWYLDTWALVSLLLQLSIYRIWMWQISSLTVHNKFRLQFCYQYWWQLMFFRFHNAIRPISVLPLTSDKPLNTISVDKQLIVDIR